MGAERRQPPLCAFPSRVLARRPSRAALSSWIVRASVSIGSEASRARADAGDTASPTERWRCSTGRSRRTNWIKARPACTRARGSRLEGRDRPRGRGSAAQASGPARRSLREHARPSRIGDEGGSPCIDRGRVGDAIPPPPSVRWRDPEGPSCTVASISNSIPSAAPSNTPQTPSFGNFCFIALLTTLVGERRVSQLPWSVSPTPEWLAA
jgi:hypothetical protein